MDCNRVLSEASLNILNDLPSKLNVLIKAKSVPVKPDEFLNFAKRQFQDFSDEVIISEKSIPNKPRNVLTDTLKQRKEKVEKRETCKDLATDYKVLTENKVLPLGTILDETKIKTKYEQIDPLTEELISPLNNETTNIMSSEFKTNEIINVNECNEHFISSINNFQKEITTDIVDNKQIIDNSIINDNIFQCDVNELKHVKDESNHNNEEINETNTFDDIIQSKDNNHERKNNCNIAIDNETIITTAIVINNLSQNKEIGVMNNDVQKEFNKIMNKETLIETAMIKNNVDVSKEIDINNIQKDCNKIMDEETLIETALVNNKIEENEEMGVLNKDEVKQCDTIVDKETVIEISNNIFDKKNKEIQTINTDVLKDCNIVIDNEKMITSCLNNKSLKTLNNKLKLTNSRNMKIKERMKKKKDIIQLCSQISLDELNERVEINDSDNDSDISSLAEFLKYPSSIIGNKHAMDKLDTSNPVINYKNNGLALNSNEMVTMDSKKIKDKNTFYDNTIVPIEINNSESFEMNLEKQIALDNTKNEIQDSDSIKMNENIFDINDDNISIDILNDSSYSINIKEKIGSVISYVVGEKETSEESCDVELNENEASEKEANETYVENKECELQVRAKSLVSEITQFAVKLLQDEASRRCLDDIYLSEQDDCETHLQHNNNQFRICFSGQRTDVEYDHRGSTLTSANYEEMIRNSGHHMASTEDYESRLLFLSGQSMHADDSQTSSSYDSDDLISRECTTDTGDEEWTSCGDSNCSCCCRDCCEHESCSCEDNECDEHNDSSYEESSGSFDQSRSVSPRCLKTEADKITRKVYTSDESSYYEEDDKEDEDSSDDDDGEEFGSDIEGDDEESDYDETMGRLSRRDQPMIFRKKCNDSFARNSDYDMASRNNVNKRNDDLDHIEIIDQLISNTVSFNVMTFI